MDQLQDAIHVGVRWIPAESHPCINVAPKFLRAEAVILQHEAYRVGAQSVVTVEDDCDYSLGHASTSAASRICWQRIYSPEAARKVVISFESVRSMVLFEGPLRLVSG